MEISPSSLNRSAMRLWFRSHDVVYSNKTVWEAELTISPIDDVLCPYEKELASELIAPMRIAKINEQISFGCFAERDIFPGDFVGEYTGLVGRLKKQETTYGFAYGNDKTIILDAREYGNETRFLNHADSKSEHCNVLKFTTIKDGYWRLFFTARRFIEARQEIRFDYGPDYFKNSSKQDNTYRLENQIAVPI